MIRYKGLTDAFSQGYRNDNSDVDADDESLLEATPSLDKVKFEPSGPSARNAAIARDASLRDILDDISKNRNPCYDGPKSYLVRRVKFTTDDEKKSKKDEKAPLYQPRNKDFIPHRTDSKGYLVMDDPVDIEDAEDLAQIGALQLAQELRKDKYCHLDLNSATFFKKGSEVRKVYSFKSPLSKSQKMKRRRKSRKDKERILITFSDSGGLVGARKYI